MVDLERREQFEDEGAHFESRYFLTLVWLPPAESSGQAERFLYEGREHDGPDPHGMLHTFMDRTDRCWPRWTGSCPRPLAR
jgi:type IV secretion system protein VirB4